MAIGQRGGQLAFIGSLIVTWLVLVSPVLAGDSTSTKSSPASKTPARTTGADDLVQTINRKLSEKWKENNITHSTRASDHEFIRRASLDIIGRIATPKEIQEFLKDPEPTRRARLIDRLLSKPYAKDYASNWANIWTILLMTRSGATAPTTSLYHEQLHQWLADEFEENKSWKEITMGLLTATGKTNENGAVNYILANLGETVPASNKQGRFSMVPATSRTTRLFLGVQTQCTQCHDHPFNTGKQVNFWSINAFFRQVNAPLGQPGTMRRQMAPSQLELTDDLNVNPDGLVFYETRKGTVLPAKPVFFLDKVKLPDPAVNRRQELAKLITQSPYFAKAYVNRLWLHFFGRGFTNPVDDFGEHNEPSHPELVEELASAFAHYGCDTKRLIRWICTSEAYGLSTVPNKTNEKSDVEPLFSRMLLKTMTPEQLFESLLAATQSEAFKSRDNRRKWMRDLTTNFGDDEGNEVTFNGTVVQALMLMNGGELNSAVSTAFTGLEKSQLRAMVKSNRAMIDYLYLAALNRSPTSGEIEKIVRIARSTPVKSTDGLTVWQDVFWALLNSNEFILNH